MKYYIRTFECNLQANLDDDFAEVLKFFFAKSPLTIIIQRNKTNVLFADKVIKLAVPNDGTCDNIMYIYDRIEQGNGTPHTMQFSNTTSLTWQPTGIPEDAIGWHWKSIAHELIHAFAAKLRGKGIYLNVDAEMDKYDQNDDPYSTTGNFSRALALLAPYWSLIGDLSPTTPQVVITRQIDQNGETVGNLNTNGFQCSTLELPYFNNQPNISCIPSGTYTCSWTFSPRLLKFTYEILAVPKRSGIRIHAANFYYQLLGCIALGSNLVDLNGDGKLDVANSVKTITAFEQIMNHKDFQLIIK